ncbi:MAG: SMC-Scp complex subunit ScpB, partial [Lachnospiraceae bacterium]|nr:SMC-Scp complex subunit ScpB [Lachnospiraceae bacterium]
LAAELGRLEKPGRPLAFGTTEEFLRYFGLSSLSDLPIVNPEKLEDFKLEVQEELQLTLDL